MKPTAMNWVNEARKRLPERLELLRALIETNSHADHAAGVQRCLELLSTPLRELGFSVEHLEAEAPDPRRPEQTLARRHLLAHRRGTVSGRPTVLILGHVDTVFPSDHPFQSLEIEDGLWRGPGASDMKGGLVTALVTLELLDVAKRLDGADVRVFFVTDEEQGSPTASQLAERAATGVDYAVCFEAARPCGGLVVARKGLMTARIEVRGQTGHAGIAHDTAVNALTSAARLIVAAESLEKEIPGLTVSPGGEVDVRPKALNSVPDYAAFELEWRYPDRFAGTRAETMLRAAIAAEAARSGAHIELFIADSVPPMAQSSEGRRLTEVYLEAARAVGLDISGVATAGVGDINVIAGFGPACLDGVGPEGAGFHTDREYVVVDSIAQRAAMNASALETLMAHAGIDPADPVVATAAPSEAVPIA